MAVNQINAKGGVDGHMITIKYYDSGITSEETVTGVQKAIGDHPTVMIGLPVSSGVQAAASVIKASGIPTLQLASDNSTDADKIGANNLFRPLATVSEEAYGQARYVASKHPKTVGIWDDSDLNAATQMKLVQTDLQGMGVKNFIYRESTLNPTDTTQQVVDMKGADALVSGGFPAAEALYAKQLVQNGITTPLTMSYGAYVTIAFKLAPQNVLNNDNWLRSVNRSPRALRWPRPTWPTTAPHTPRPTSSRPRRRITTPSTPWPTQSRPAVAACHPRRSSRTWPR